MQQETLKQRHDLHISRKIWHGLGVISMAAIYNLIGHKASWIGLILFSAIMIPLDLLRQSHPGLNRLTVKIFGPVMRRSEYQSLSGLTYLLIGVLFLLLLNEPHIVTLTLLFLAVGDPFASLFGLRYGKDKIIGNKTLQGTMGAFAVCAIIAGVYYYYHNLMTERLLIVAPLSGLIGAIAELVPIGKLDDNLTFPLIASSLLWALFFVYGGFPV
jgi:dolichol kinase